MSDVTELTDRIVAKQVDELSETQRARQVLREAEGNRLAACREALQELLQEHGYALAPEITIGPSGVVRASVNLVPV